MTLAQLSSQRAIRPLQSRCAMEMAALLLLVSAVAAFRTLPSIPNINEYLTLSRLQTAYNPLPLSELKVTDNFINLRRAESYYSLSSMYYQALRRQAAGSSSSGVSRATVRVKSPSAGELLLRTALTLR